MESYPLGIGAGSHTNDNASTAGSTEGSDLEKESDFGRNVLLIRGKSTGTGLIQVTAKNRKSLKTLKVPANTTYTFRIKLYPGRNVIVVQSADSIGNLSTPIRIVVTKS
jgi:hypothetical protein